MPESPIKTYFSTKEIHKFILFVATIILIFSLFFETKTIDNSLVQKGAFTFFIIGLLWWFVFEIMSICFESYLENTRDSEKDKQINAMVLFWLRYIILLIGFLIGLAIVF